MMFSKKQEQKSGDYSVNLQAKSIQVTYNNRNNFYHNSPNRQNYDSSKIDYLTSKKELDELILKQIIHLEPNPHFYFWRSEGRSSTEVLNLCHSILKKRGDRVLLNNLSYYYGLHYLQAGDYIKAKKYLKYFIEFIKEIDNKKIIYLTALMHFGKSLFYLQEYQKAYQLWEYIRKKMKVVFPSGYILDYYDASMTWREYLIESCLVSCFEERTIAKKFKDLIEITGRVGSHQIKNYWFAIATSEYLNNDFEACIYSLEKLKTILKKDFNQPMFMIAALLLEARALSSLGGQQEKYSSSIILESLNNLKINWNSQLFINNFCHNSYLSLYSQIEKSNHHKDIIYESKKNRQTNDCFRYIYNNLTIDNINM